MFSFNLWLMGFDERLTKWLGDWRHDWRKLPNLVTFVRLLLLWVPIWLLFAYRGHVGGQWLAAGVFALVALTDKVDGSLARSRHEITKMGIFMDPLADKLLVFLLLFAVCWLPTSPWWLQWVVVATSAIMAVREIHVTVKLRLIDTPIPAAWSGKVKMTVQSCMVASLLLPLGHCWGWWWMVQLGLTVAALTTSIWSWIDYHRKFVVVLQAKQAEQAEFAKAK